MYDSLYNGLISGGAGAFTAYLICTIQRRLDRREEEDRRKTEEALNEERKVNEKQRIARLDKLEDKLETAIEKIDTHIQSDRNDVILNELKNISGMQSSQNAVIAGMSGEIKQLLVSDGQKNEKLDSLDRYIKGVHQSLCEHKTNHPGATKK